MYIFHKGKYTVKLMFGLLFLLFLSLHRGEVGVGNDTKHTLYVQRSAGKPLPLMWFLFACCFDCFLVVAINDDLFIAIVIVCFANWQSLYQNFMDCHSQNDLS